MLKMQNVQNEYNSVSRNSNNLGQKKNSCKIDHQKLNTEEKTPIVAKGEKQQMGLGFIKRIKTRT